MPVPPRDPKGHRTGYTTGLRPAAAKAAVRVFSWGTPCSKMVQEEVSGSPYGGARDHRRAGRRGHGEEDHPRPARALQRISILGTTPRSWAVPRRSSRISARPTPLAMCWISSARRGSSGSRRSCAARSWSLHPSCGWGIGGMGPPRGFRRRFARVPGSGFMNDMRVVFYPP
jgi:hypothetical protein